MAKLARRTTNLGSAGQGDAPVGPEMDDLPAFRSDSDLEVAVGLITEGREEIDRILGVIKERFSLGHLGRAASDTLAGTAVRARPGSKGLLLAAAATGCSLLLGFGVLFRLRTKRKTRRKKNRFPRFSAYPQKSV